MTQTGKLYAKLKKLDSVTMKKKFDSQLSENGSCSYDVLCKMKCDRGLKCYCRHANIGGGMF